MSEPSTRHSPDRKRAREFADSARLRDMRPLDAVRSIKVKLGLLVAVSVAAASALVWYGLVVLGWWPRITLPVAVVLALVVTHLLARGMTSPLRELTVAARAMAAGDYSRRVRATSSDEVGEAARAFNRMAEDLAAVDTQRRELLANVSHELRTPIAALRAVLENLVDGVSRPDPATLATALDQAERLSRLVEELLELSRVDAGMLALQVQPVPLTNFLRAAVREAEMAGRPVRFVVAVEPADLTVTADPARLRQLVANLLDNAARHSPAGGEVTVGAVGTSTGVRLEVTDTGPGIPQADRERVFERFSRGGTATPGDGGTGLGLAIARWVTDLHGGSIAVVGEGSGCRIHVQLPERPPDSS